MRFVRRQLGVEAFGVNWFELPPNSEGREHDETGTGQEEVNIVDQRRRHLSHRRRGGTGARRRWRCGSIRRRCASRSPARTG